MPQPRRYIHIGYPKAASTSLQVSLFDRHPDLYHLGLGNRTARCGGYIDHDIATAMEIDLRFSRDLTYRGDVVSELFNRHFEAAALMNKSAVGVSLEFFSFTLQNEIDLASKARRLRELFGEDTSVIVICREQISLLRALYLELVKGGYPGSFQRFLEYTYVFQDRNWCVELCFDKVVDLYSGLFGSTRIHVIPFELLASDPSNFVFTICRSVGVSPDAIVLEHLNQRLDSLGTYERIRRINALYPHGCGAGFYEPFGCGRISHYFERTLGVQLSPDIAASEFMQFPVRDAATRLQAVYPTDDIDLSCEGELLSRLVEIYAPSNERLMAHTGVDVASHGYITSVRGRNTTSLGSR